MRADLEALERELNQSAGHARIGRDGDFLGEAEYPIGDVVIVPKKLYARLLATLRAGVVDRAPAAWWRHCIANGEWHRHDGLTHLAVLMLDGADLSSRGTREDAMRNSLAAALGRTDTGEG